MSMSTNLFAAEAGMPQLDPKYWISQVFWLVLTFGILYILISKYFLPKIKKNLDDRENKIKNDLEEAKNLKDLAEQKQSEYELILRNAKKEVLKIFLDSKNKLNKEIQAKKNNIEREIDTELAKANEEITALKNSSVKDIHKISEDLASKIIEEISGDKLNESSIKATISQISKNNIEKHL